MICKKCGKEMNDEERYCLRCGHDQTVSIEQTQIDGIFDEKNNNQNSGTYSNRENKNYTKIIIGVVVALVVVYLVFNIVMSIFAGIMVENAGREVRGMHNTVMDALTPVEFD